MERLRIVELYADILHYSNMVMPNRSPGSKPAFDDTGRLVGGLAALNDLVEAMLGAKGANEQAVDEEDENDDASTDQEEEEEIERPSFPISSAQRKPLYESDSDVDSTEGPHENAIIPTPSVDIALVGPDRSTPPVPTLSGTSSASSIDQLAERLSSLSVPGSPEGGLRSSSKSERQFSPTSGTKSPGGTGASSTGRAGSILHMSPSDRSSTSTSKPINVEELTKPLGERLKERYLALGVLNALLVSRSPSHELVLLADGHSSGFIFRVSLE
jgi:serine/threonine-protein phosphatase 6 regulatory subunit 3